MIRRLSGPRPVTVRRDAAERWVAWAAKRKPKPKPIPLLDDDGGDEMDVKKETKTKGTDVDAEPTNTASTASSEGKKQVRPGRTMADLRRFQEERRLMAEAEEAKRKRAESLENMEREEIVAGDLKPQIDEVKPGVTVITPPKVAAKDAPLPEGWSKYEDKQGRVGYYNLQTRESSMVPPEVSEDTEVALNATASFKELDERRQNTPYTELELSDDPYDYVSWMDVEKAKVAIEKEREIVEKRLMNVENQLEKLLPQSEYYAGLVDKMEKRTSELTELINKIEFETPEERTERELEIEALREKTDPITEVIETVETLADMTQELAEKLGPRFAKDPRRLLGKKEKRQGYDMAPDLD